MKGHIWAIQRCCGVNVRTYNVYGQLWVGDTDVVPVCKRALLKMSPHLTKCWYLYQQASSKGSSIISCIS